MKSESRNKTNLVINSRIRLSLSFLASFPTLPKSRSYRLVSELPTPLSLMNFLSSLSSAVLSASSAALQNATATGIPGISGYTLGDRVTSYQGKSIWTLYSGIKRVSLLSLFFQIVGRERGADSFVWLDEQV